ncbi:MAG: hypothetical protein GOVbin1807_130 [Prokaryotic dsDNA virus sp.]|nr:MAG: hypothetical protein GOVbin1807_130 [Prokaryotic dsDNA virus sp.]|tara:strand:- start:875 stop:1123 length:249 start_codon:yes stop_codon:yes gene_type:complete
MSNKIQDEMNELYKSMLNLYPLSYEEFKTKEAEQDPNFQGVAIILREGLYAFEKLDFEETQETINDNQETTESENETPTSTY